MSAGNFVRSKYEMDNGTIVRIKVQPETEAFTVATVANAPPAGDISPGFPSARVGKSSREYGIGTRSVSFTFTADAPANYQEGGILRLPILQGSVWDGIAEGATGTYLGGTIEVLSKSNEDVD